MLFLFVFTVITSRVCVGVIIDGNGYYTWRSNPIEWQLSRLTTWVSPNYYSPYLQNPSPYFVGQRQENFEINTIKIQQTTIFNILNCLMEKKNKDLCKKMLDKVTTASKPQIQIDKPIIFQINSVYIKHKIISEAESNKSLEKIKENSREPESGEKSSNNRSEEPKVLLGKPANNVVLKQKIVDVESSTTSKDEKITPSEISTKVTGKDIADYHTIVSSLTNIDNEAASEFDTIIKETDSVQANNTETPTSIESVNTPATEIDSVESTTLK